MTATRRVRRAARQQWVHIGQMSVYPPAQRKLRSDRVEKIAAHFDAEKFGIPTVSYRDGTYWIIDGNHRVTALRRLGGDDQSVQCTVYDGLTPDDEAAMFLALNDQLNVSSYSKFTVGVTAGLPEETVISNIVEKHGLRVAIDKNPGSIPAVGTLRKMYRRGGELILSRTLRIVRDAFGDAGMRAPVLEGVGLVCQRYGDNLDDDHAVNRLSTMHGGVHGLLGKAEFTRRQVGSSRAQCVAATVVDVVRTGANGKRLTSWWRERRAS